MKTFKRRCIESKSYKTAGLTVSIKEGKKYLTSAVDEYGFVTVFSTYWFQMPASCFNKGRVFTQ